MALGNPVGLLSVAKVPHSAVGGSVGHWPWCSYQVLVLQCAKIRIGTYGNLQFTYVYIMLFTNKNPIIWRKIQSYPKTTNKHPPNHCILSMHAKTIFIPYSNTNWMIFRFRLICLCYTGITGITKKIWKGPLKSLYLWHTIHFGTWHDHTSKTQRNADLKVFSTTLL